MNRENRSWPFLAIVMLAGGWLVSRRLLLSSPADLEVVETFREWLWGTRSLDLALQVGIVFVGALGIAALLPRGNGFQRRGGPPHDEREIE